MFDSTTPRTFLAPRRVYKNPQFEYRNPRQIQRQKFRNPKRAGFELSHFLPFEIVSSFEFASGSHFFADSASRYSAEYFK
jgi:hypothetical protein